MIKCQAWPLTIGFLVLIVGMVVAAIYRPDLDVTKLLGIVVSGLVSALAVMSGESQPTEQTQEAPDDAGTHE